MAGGGGQRRRAIAVGGGGLGAQNYLPVFSGDQKTRLDIFFLAAGSQEKEC